MAYADTKAALKFRDALLSSGSLPADIFSHPRARDWLLGLVKGTSPSVWISKAGALRDQIPDGLAPDVVAELRSTGVVGEAVLIATQRRVPFATYEQDRRKTIRVAFAASRFAPVNAVVAAAETLSDAALHLIDTARLDEPQIRDFMCTPDRLDVLACHPGWSLVRNKLFNDVRTEKAMYDAFCRNSEFPYADVNVATMARLAEDDGFTVPGAVAHLVRVVSDDDDLTKVLVNNAKFVSGVVDSGVSVMHMCPTVVKAVVQYVLDTEGTLSERWLDQLPPRVVAPLIDLDRRADREAVASRLLRRRSEEWSELFDRYGDISGVAQRVVADVPDMAGTLFHDDASAVFAVFVDAAIAANVTTRARDGGVRRSYPHLVAGLFEGISDDVLKVVAAGSDTFVWRLTPKEADIELKARIRLRMSRVRELADPCRVAQTVPEGLIVELMQTESDKDLVACVNRIASVLVDTPG